MRSQELNPKAEQPEPLRPKVPYLRLLQSLPDNVYVLRPKQNEPPTAARKLC